MKFIVASREEAERGLLVREPYVVISIRDPSRPKAYILRPGHVPLLAFHDGELSPKLALPKGTKAMTLRGRGAGARLRAVPAHESLW